MEDIEKRLLESRYRMLCAEQQLEQLRVDHAMLLLEKALLEKGLDKQTIDAMILKAIEEAHKS
jgi:response regulator of citrate/malate metabolism